jgi:L-iditol 2-dehydrogenase
MWAYELVAPRELALRDVDCPAPGDLVAGEVLVRLRCGAICGSDVPSFRGQPDPAGRAVTVGYPLHEIVAEVVETNSDLLKKGDRVVGSATGAHGMREYSVNDASQLLAVTSSLSDQELVAVQPLATVLNALTKVPVIEGKWAAVIGQGPLGLLISHVLKSKGASKVTGIDRIDRSEVGERFGVDDSVWQASSTWAASLPDSPRPGIVVEAVGHQIATMNDAIEAAGHDGHVVAFGVPDDPYYPINFTKVFRKHLTITTGVTHDWKRFLSDALAYLEDATDLARSYVTHTFAIGDVQQAFECAETPARGRLKVALLV